MTRIGRLISSCLVGFHHWELTTEHLNEPYWICKNCGKTKLVHHGFKEK